MGLTHLIHEMDNRLMEEPMPYVLIVGGNVHEFVQQLMLTSNSFLRCDTILISV